MNYRPAAGIVTAFVFGLCLWVGNTVASAQSADASKYRPARPVYLDIHPIADAGLILNEGLVAAMVRQKLSSEHIPVIRMQGDALPTSVRVLRVFYIVHQQPSANGVVMAATAKVDLLRTATDRHDTLLATSIYSGVQQSLVQDTNTDAATERVRGAFKKTLDKRIHAAFTNTAAQ